MKENVKAFLDKVKAGWDNFGKNIKTIIIVVAGLVLLLAVILTIKMNVPDGYIVLFPSMTSSESTEVYLELQNMGVSTRINSTGEIEVPKDQWDSLVFELAERGYPQSTPSYGTFFDNLSMTMTEFEKKTNT